LRYFFRRRIPQVTRVLLVESGSREIARQVMTSMRAIYGEDLDFGLVTCYQGQPAGFRGPVYRVTEYGGPAGREKLLADVLAHDYPIAGIICSAQPIMTKWKWWLGWRLPAKILVVNENADYFWLDWGQWRTVLKFMLYRGGLTGPAAVPALLRLALFPATLTYLLMYAGAVHLRRRIRML
jgi:hypothetical protein